jgi:hypothetical protein
MTRTADAMASVKQITGNTIVKYGTQTWAARTPVKNKTYSATAAD